MNDFRLIVPQASSASIPFRPKLAADAASPARHGISFRRPAPFHFLSYDLVVRSDENLKRYKLLARWLRVEPIKSVFKGGNTLREA